MLKSIKLKKNYKQVEDTSVLDVWEQIMEGSVWL